MYKNHGNWSTTKEKINEVIDKATQVTDPDESLTILGIDPGLQKTGWGVIKRVGNSLKYVNSGIIATNSGEFNPDDINVLKTRLQFIYKSTKQLLETYKPDIVAIERIFINMNGKTSMKLENARTAVILAVSKDFILTEFPPCTVKKAVTGIGSADKDIVANAVKKLLRNDKIKTFHKSSDNFDALAIACTVFLKNRPTLS